MTLPFLLGYTQVPPSDHTQDDINALLAQYTHTCGYTRAWQDSVDPLWIWLLPDCPADAVIDGLKINISNYVVAAYNNQLSQDMYQRVVAIIEETEKDALNWLNQHTYERLVNFIGQPARLHALVVAELIAQGAIS